MVDITYTGPAAKFTRIKNATKGLYPIPQIDDPDNEGQVINEFSDGAWVKEFNRRRMIQDVRRYEEKVAKDAVAVVSDDTLLT